jgi:hypothetical protein
MKRALLVLFVVGTMVSVPAIADDPKGHGPSGTGDMPRDMGGPDPFGYEYIDSAEPSGPAFSWIDISATGTNLNLGDDDETGLMDIGFTFNFYGIDHTQINVNSNGMLYFTDDALTSDYSNDCINANAGFDPDVPLIAVFWDDLNPSSAGDVYMETIGTAPERQLVIMWDQVNPYGLDGPVSFQAILNESDSSILMQYLDTTTGDGFIDAGASATCGVSDNVQDLTWGLEYSCNAPALTEDLAILFYQGTYEAPTPGIPTLNPWGIAGLLLAMAGAAIFILRRR